MNEMNNWENNNQNIEQPDLNENQNMVQPEQQNVEPVEPVSEPSKKEEKKSYCGLLVVFMIISLLLAGFIVYDKVIKKEEPVKSIDDNNVETLQKIDKSQGWIYMETVAEYEIIDAEDGKNVNIKYEYPVINIDTKDAKKYNSDVKKEVTDKNDKFISHNALSVGCSENSEDDLSTYIMNNGQKKYIGYYDADNYQTKETDDYIIIFSKAGFTPIMPACDWINGVSIFAISKKTGEEISNKSLVGLQGYNYDEILKELYKKYYLENKDYYDNDCLDDNNCLNSNPTELDYNKFAENRAIIMVKLTDKLEIFVQPENVDQLVEHYYYDNNNFTLIEE